MKRSRPNTGFTPRKKQNTATRSSNLPAVVYSPKKRITYVEYKATDASWADNYGASGVNDLPKSITANLVRGDSGINNFEGNKIFPVGLELRLDVYSNATGPTTCLPIRVIVFQWYDSAAPVLAGLLQTTGLSSSTISPKLLTNRENIRILMDKKYVLNTFYPTGASVRSALSIKKFIKGFKMSDMTMAAGANTVQKGDIFIVFLADTNTAGEKPFFQGYTRLTFTD